MMTSAGPSSVWKCPLGRENDAGSKENLPVSRDDFFSAFGVVRFGNVTNLRRSFQSRCLSMSSSDEDLLY